jgi:hypothetical protein
LELELEWVVASEAEWVVASEAEWEAASAAWLEEEWEASRKWCLYIRGHRRR